MPGGNGMTVLERLNQRRPEERPRAIVLTARGRVPAVVKAMRLGASDFLEKPTTPEDLRLSVAAALEEQQDGALEQPASGPSRGSPASVQLGQALSEIRQAVWNQDIHHCEFILGALFRKAWSDSAYFVLLGAVFEAEGNRGAARTFYQKATSSPSAGNLAATNLWRLAQLETGAADVADAALGGQMIFLKTLCDQHAAHQARNRGVES